MLTVADAAVRKWAADGATEDPKTRANLPKHLREKKPGKCFFLFVNLVLSPNLLRHLSWIQSQF